jgi:very-short-patch-repair endonuclease
MKTLRGFNCGFRRGRKRSLGTLYGYMPGSVPRDVLVARLAARQYGHVTRAQLLALGFTRHSIESRLENGRLIEVHRGVYAVGHPRPEAIARAAAAVLAGGDDAILSYFSAAALWEMGTRWPRIPEITVPARRRPSGIRVHVHPALESRDIRRHREIRVTSPARTLLDIAPRTSDAQLARAVNEARLNARLRVPHLAELLDRESYHPGLRLLRPFVEHPTGPTRSQFEDRFLAFARTYDLPTPRVNAHVAGHEVDILFEAEKVVVELDGWDFHSDRRSFERDRNKDADLALAGYLVVRITWERLTQTPAQEAARLHDILSARRATP